NSDFDRGNLFGELGVAEFGFASVASAVELAVMADDGVRVDKWLWATRFYKTRTLATEACAGDHVKIGGVSVKPGRVVRRGEVVEVRLRDITRTVRVKAILEKRVGAKLVDDYLEDLTPESEYER